MSKVMIKGSFTQLMTSTVFVLTDLADLNFDSVCFSIQAFDILRKKVDTCTVQCKQW